jgi:hypothetical protein
MLATPRNMTGPLNDNSKIKNHSNRQKKFGNKFVQKIIV